MNAKAIALTLLLLVGSVHAEERKPICAKPENGRSAYAVEGILTTGAELNQQTHTFNYEHFSRYVVIFWKEHQATVILMDGMGIVSAFPIDGKDQEGRRWTVALNGGVCYL